MVVVASAGYVPGYPTAYYTELFLDFVSTINRPAEEISTDISEFYLTLQPCGATQGKCYKQ